LELKMLSPAFAEISSPSLAEVLERNFETSAPVRQLVRNEILFKTGDVKASLYRVETGVLCIYATRSDLKLEVIEFALAGDLVGMGFLETHASSARATVETKVKCFALADMDRLTARDDRARARFDAAVQREFVFRRESLVKAGREQPVMRLAAFLIAVSSRNREEGRDATLIDDALNCAVIAQYLNISVDLLALALVQLEMQGLVQPAPRRGLRLNNLAALEVIANEAGSTC